MNGIMPPRIQSCLDDKNINNKFQTRFINKGNNNISGTTIDDKSLQWFGASLYSSGEDGIVVACAPRYVYFSLNRQRREPVGTCYTATDSFSKFSEYSPCRTVAWGFHQQGYCQAGFSCAISDDRLFIGAIGAYYAQGQVFSQNLKNRLDYFASQEGPENQDDSYLGYSLATGDFTGTNSVDLAVGVPRGANFTGKVVLFTGRRLFNLHNLTGNQVGSYFGYSLATFDGNGDGLDDLAIGAPFQSSKLLGGLSEKYETGRVYVVYQNAAHKFRHWDIIDGKEIGGRFGLSLTNLGDINGDGFKDLAIGAPYSEYNRGSVFIHLGSSKGISKEPDQIIHGSNQGITIPKGFGFAISGSNDLDGNGYPDLIVGAPDSNQVYLFRSRAVVRVNSVIFFESVGGKIKSESRNCSLSSGLHVACIYIKSCLEYTGRGVEDELDFLVTWMLDYRKKNNYRMYFLNNEHSRSQKKIMKLKRNMSVCSRSLIYLLPEVVDKLSPIDASMTCEIYQKFSKEYYGNNTLQPILDPRDIKKKVTDRIFIQKDCGIDNICVPNLGIIFNKSTENYLVGSEERFELDITIFNHGEAAYETTFYLHIPNKVYYKKMRMINIQNEKNISIIKHRTPKILCSPPSQKNNFYLKCDLGNPMTTLSKISFKIVLKPVFDQRKISSLNFEMLVNSSNPESDNTLEDNIRNISVPVIIKTELKIRGRSDPEPLEFNISAYDSYLRDFKENALINKEFVENFNENDVGPEVTHVYQVENKGPSDILGAEVFILWPSFRTYEDEPLLYLTTQPQIRGNVKCNYVDDVNPYGIKINEQRNMQISESFREKRSQLSIRTNNSKNIVSSYISEMDLSRVNDIDSHLNCGQTKCTLIYCSIGPLHKREFALFRLRSRLWSKTISELAKSNGQKDFEISSKLISRVTDLPYGMDPVYLGFESLRITTHVQTLVGNQESVKIPAWILVLSIFAGLIFLAFLSLLLNKFGFFRRKRPYNNIIVEKNNSCVKVSEERQPLALDTTKESRFNSCHSFQPANISEKVFFYWITFPIRNLMINRLILINISYVNHDL
ncbi:integrin alpha-PS2 isoform X2 [Lepeophtheirus salmonis]|uniref:integrin alpha-PS2 isoform X2 n=1 Tax=Lepeophtheirus salmonis TaxID=72036 RepID=UPI003AF38CF2